MYNHNLHSLHLCMDYMFRIFGLIRYFLLFIEIIYVPKMVPYWHMDLSSHFLSNVTLIKKIKAPFWRRHCKEQPCDFFKIFWLHLHDDIEFLLSLILKSLGFLMIKFRKKSSKIEILNEIKNIYIWWESRLNDESTGINSDK